MCVRVCVYVPQWTLYVHVRDRHYICVSQSSHLVFLAFRVMCDNQRQATDSQEGILVSSCIHDETA